MKTALAAFLIVCSALADPPIRIAWDSSDTAGVTYTLYASNSELKTDTFRSAVYRLDCGTNNKAMVKNLSQRSAWWFGVTAVGTNNIESDLSNVISHTPR
jgi:hypothetical protein